MLAAIPNISLAYCLSFPLYTKTMSPTTPSYSSSSGVIKPPQVRDKYARIPSYWICCKCLPATAPNRDLRFKRSCTECGHLYCKYCDCDAKTCGAALAKE